MKLPVGSKSFVRELGRSSHSGRYQDSGVITGKVNITIPSLEVFLVLQEFSSSQHRPTHSTKMGLVSE